VGGLTFAARQQGAAIKIVLNADARIFKYRGPDTECPFQRLAGEYDVAFLDFENPGIRFREVLLLSEQKIRRWSYDVEELRRDYITQMTQLEAGQIPSDEFFYPDLAPQEQLLAARLVGHHIGLFKEEPANIAGINKTLSQAYRRIGVEGDCMERKLFFCDRDALVNFANLSAGPDRSRDRIFSLHKHFRIPWDEFSSKVHEVVEEFARLKQDQAISEMGPFHLTFLSPVFDHAYADWVSFLAGVSVPFELTSAGFESTRMRDDWTVEVDHHGSFLRLDSTYEKVRAQLRTVAVLKETYYKFCGARSDENHIRISAL